MQNKLQELTDKLYNEGLSKGKEEGAAILQKAKEEAEKVREETTLAATATMRKAAQDAEALKQKAESDIRMASEQSLAATRKDIENLLIGKIVDSKVCSALSDPDFLKEIIRTVAEKFSASQAVDMSLVLPQSLKDELEPWVAGELKKVLSNDVEATFSKKISGGFTIGPKDGSYFISLSDETFRQLIGEYLRPVTRKIIFGE